MNLDKVAGAEVAVASVALVVESVAVVPDNHGFFVHPNIYEPRTRQIRHAPFLKRPDENKGVTESRLVMNTNLLHL